VTETPVVEAVEVVESKVETPEVAAVEETAPEVVETSAEQSAPAEQA